MTEPTQEQTSDHAVKHFAWGTLPAALSGLALLIQGLTHAVPAPHTGILYVLAGAGIVASATVLLWCTSIRIKNRFEARADAQDTVLDETRRLVAHISNSTQALHKKLDRACTDQRDLRAEVEHLQRLVLEAAEPPTQRSGPRALR